MNAVLSPRKDVILPFTLFSFIELGDLVYLEFTSYVCQVHITYTPLWQDELLTCQLHTGLDRNLSILYRFSAAVWGLD